MHSSFESLQYIDDEYIDNEFINIESNGYSFSVQIEKALYEPDEIMVYIGGNKASTPACVKIVIYPEANYAQIIDVVHKNTCCKNKDFKRGGEGIKLLLQSALTWCIKRYSFIQYFVLTDKSMFDDFWLPEMKMLREGTTWYAKHFGAKPADYTTSHLVKKYLNRFHQHTEYLNSLPDSVWTNKDDSLKNLLVKLRLEQLSGKQWIIDKQTVINYRQHVDEYISGGANNKKKQHTACRYFRIRKTPFISNLR